MVQKMADVLQNQFGHYFWNILYNCFVN
jgi:hypothetical protein